MTSTVDQHEVRVTGLDLHVSAVLEDDTRIAGRLDDLTSQQVSILFKCLGAPRWAVGNPAKLEFMASGAEAPIQVPATVTQRHERVAGRVYCLQLESWKDFWSQLPEALRQTFNQRGAVRVQPEPTDPVEVHISTDSNQAQGQMRDISVSGIAVMLPAAAEEQLVGHQMVELSLKLPGWTAPSILTAEIRHRHLDGEHVHYGMSFVTTSLDFAAQQQALETYVLSRQGPENHSQAG